ncbi:MAG: RNA-binding S4 domain-containing protein [Rhizobiaceae bacterium]|nr:RNA-binding S4 domain-containing protein [Rhizobiaceae bacterium]
MASDTRQRVDKWLFFARVVKSRSLAQKLVTGGRVRINRDKAAQSSDQVGGGDVLTITLDRRILVYRVLLPGTHRGPAEEARKLYEDLSPPVVRDAPPDAIAPLRDAGSGRPTKRDRRAIDRLTEPE